jgi:hypothetical protein
MALNIAAQKLHVFFASGIFAFNYNVMCSFFRHQGAQKHQSQARLRNVKFPHPKSNKQSQIPPGAIQFADIQKH